MTLADEIIEKVKRLESQRIVLDDESMRHLRVMWNSIWAEVYYDPASDSSQKYAAYLLPHINALNERLKFK